MNNKIENASPDAKRELEIPKLILAGMPDYFIAREGKEAWKDDSHPVYLMMNLDTKCSCNCIKCALHGRKREPGPPLTTQERTAFLDQNTATLGLKELVIIGYGEPTEDFGKVEPLIREAHSQGMGTVIFSNLGFLTKEQAEFFRDHEVTLIVSLDAVDENTYNFLIDPNKRKGMDLNKVLKNLELLKETYRQNNKTINEQKVVRLGINTTVCKQNVDHLEEIKQLVGRDMMYIANPPMREGNLTQKDRWNILVGNQYDYLAKRAAEVSQTGGHSSLAEGSCSYFNRGLSVDSDGELLTCGYAVNTAHSIGNIKDNLSPQQLKNIYRKNREVFEKYRQETGDEQATCPLRSKNFEDYCRRIASAHSKRQKENPFNILE
ncbi:MAG: radical SAM protein [Patescibacteria group bacterium]|nr:radical SAM protein [Patescibacteria group bacterium]